MQHVTIPEYLTEQDAHDLVAAFTEDMHGPTPPVCHTCKSRTCWMNQWYAVQLAVEPVLGDWNSYID